MYSPGLPGYSFGARRENYEVRWGWWANNKCDGPITFGPAFGVNVNKNSLTALNGLDAPRALSSFPACDGVTSGRLLYDTTNAVWRWCDGYNWRAVASEDYVAASRRVRFTGVCFGSPCAMDTNFTGGYYSNDVEVISNVTCSWATAGSGGTEGVVIEVRNVDNAVTVCSCTLGACNTAANTPLRCACPGSVGARRLVFRLSSSTDCATRPGNIVCNAG
jgi:hypothetical protein